MEGIQRIDETPVHKAVREAFVNLIIHADYLMDAGVLKVIKKSDGFEFTNPGILKLPLEAIYRGGVSKSRNPHMQTMLRMVGFGDNAGSGFPTILHTWEQEGWVKPELIEDTSLNQVTLKLNMMPIWMYQLQKLESQVVLNLNTSPEQIQTIKDALETSIGNISIPKIDGIETALKAFANGMPSLKREQLDVMYSALKNIKENFRFDKELSFNSERFAEVLMESAEKSAESAEKSAEFLDYDWMDLSDRQKQILGYMELECEYSTEEIARRIGLKGARTRQLLNDLVVKGFVVHTAYTKNRRYVRVK